jgi:hypothetical protein
MLEIPKFALGSQKSFFAVDQLMGFEHANNRFGVDGLILPLC